MATFITSKAVGETLSIRVYSNTDYWKYNHNGVYSNVYQNQHENVNIPVVNADGEFTLLPCDSQGNISGEIYAVSLSSGYGNPGNEVTSFDGSSLNLTAYLDLSKNLLTSFSVTGMSNLTTLHLYDNLLTSFSGVGLDSLTHLELNRNPLTSFIGTGLSSLRTLFLDDCKLTSFNGTGLINLTSLSLGLGSLNNWQSSLTSFIGGDMSKITTLDFTYWGINSLTSFNATGLTGLTTLKLGNNTSLTSTSFNNSILDLLNSNSVNGGTFHSSKGRTSIGTADYNNLISRGWTLIGVDLVQSITFITSKAVGETLTINGYHIPYGNDNSYIQTTTGYWKYYHNGVYSNIFGDSHSHVSQTITVGNANGEFTFISCDSNGSASGNITHLILPKNKITAFNGSDLTGLVNLNLTSNSIVSDLILPPSLGVLTLTDNKITTFNGTGLSNLVELVLNVNSLSSFNAIGLSNLTILDLQYNQLASVDVTGLSNLTILGLRGNQLTTLNVSGLTNLNALYISENPITTSTNNSILDVLNSNNVNGGNFESINGRTSIGTPDYNSLISRGWTLIGVDLLYQPLPTFITAKSVGQKINVYANTSTGYWKYNHNGSDSSIFTNGQQNNIKVSNVNGEFEIIPCDSNGIFSGALTKLNLQNNRITTFNGTLLSSLTYLNLYGNRLIQFNDSGMSNLTYLNLQNNRITTFNGTLLSSLTYLNLYGNRLTTFNGSGMFNLNSLNLHSNRLTSFITTDLSNLNYLDLYGNRLTQFNGSVMSNLTYLNLYGNQLTGFNGTSLSSLNSLDLYGNRLTTFNGSGMSNLTSLNLYGNRLTQFDGTSLSSLTDLDLSSNRLTTFNGAGLSSLTKLNLYGNRLTSFIGGNMGLISSLNFQTWNITTLTTFNCAGLSSLTYLYMVYNTGISSIINNQILQDLNTNGLSNGTFMSNNGRTSVSNSNYTSLINKNWTFNATPNATIYANGLNVFLWGSFDEDEIIGLPGDITTTEIPGLYSLKKISATYSGPAIQIRRSYDNALMDIGFTTDGSLDLTTIYSFVGTASGYLTTFYDQMATPNNSLTQPQTSIQPMIVSNGVSVSFQMPGEDTSGATASQPAEFNWWRKKGKIIKNLSKPVTMNITEPSQPFVIHEQNDYFIYNNNNWY